ncbi:MAG TPA: zinc ribbon domain-containing protein [Herpetosiphonaceae bacterium]
MNCPKCNRTNPEDARYCIYCSAQLVPPAPDVQDVAPATGPTTRLGGEQIPVYTVPAPAPLPAPAPQAAAASYPGRWAHNKEIGGAVFLIGLGILFLTGRFWPGILVLIGLTAFINEGMRGHSRNALQGLVFFLGLAVLFSTGWFWPGILILLGLMALFNGRRGFC